MKDVGGEEVGWSDLTSGEQYRCMETGRDYSGTLTTVPHRSGSLGLRFVITPGAKMGQHQEQAG